MSVFKLPVCVCKEIDGIRKKILWQGVSADTKKIHLVNWDLTSIYVLRQD